MKGVAAVVDDVSPGGYFVSVSGIHSVLRLTFTELLKAGDVRFTEHGVVVNGVRQPAWDGVGVRTLLEFFIFREWLHVTVVNAKAKQAAFVAAYPGPEEFFAEGEGVSSPEFRAWQEAWVRTRTSDGRVFYKLESKPAAYGSFTSEVTSEVTGLFGAYKRVASSAFAFNRDLLTK